MNTKQFLLWLITSISLNVFALDIKEIGFESSSRNTRLAIDSDFKGGRYETLVSGERIYGHFTITDAVAQGELNQYYGLFTDYNGDSICSGQMTITVYRNLLDDIVSDVQWVIGSNSNQHCTDAAGTQFNVSLKEALPMANRYGDYTSNNANTLPSISSGNATWPLWQVIDSEGLNCRLGYTSTEPDAYGNVVAVIPPGTLVDVSYPRAPNAVFIDGNTLRSYLKIEYYGSSCWVRAHQHFIQPASVAKSSLAL